MKQLLIVLFGIVYSAEGALLMADVYNLARRCNKQPEVNGTEDDVNDILMGFLPETRSGMCMLRCMEIHAGILVNDTYDVRGAYLFFRKHFPENPYCKNMERGVRFCERLILKRKKPDMEPCQHAHMVAACIKRRIKYVPGTRAAFYRPFVWKNPSKKDFLKPAKKYFEVVRKIKPKLTFEIITKPTRKYTLDDLKEPLVSGESIDPDAKVWLPPRPRKGKWKSTDKRKKKKKDSEDDSDEDEEEEDWDKSSKTRRHQKKMFRI